ncbi:WD40 repeat domain-containing protein, partial [Nonomuraea lactucae]|uniref:WD40 repeat domain-containing protein n=1 Tax=Nonomuraea lactucae TaxID=2249762 RepID=UPI0013B39CD6
ATPATAGATPAASSSPAATLVATPPRVTPSVTSAPVATVAPKAEREVKLADVGATLYEHPTDPVWLAAYLQVKRPFKTFARDRTGRFKEIGLAEAPQMSPDGDWVALNPWLKFQNTDMDKLRFTRLSTGESFEVTTVKKPEQSWFPAWSHDGTRVVASITDDKRKKITGFVHVDVVARKATVVRTEYVDDLSLPFTFTPDGSIARGYTAAKNRGFETYDMSGKVTRNVHWVGSPRDVSWYSPSGKKYVTVCPNREDVCVWDTSTGVRKATIGGIKNAGYLLGWFNEDHILVREPTRKKGRDQIKIVSFLGETQRVLAELPSRSVIVHFAPKAPR